MGTLAPYTTSESASAGAVFILPVLLDSKLLLRDLYLVTRHSHTLRAVDFSDRRSDTVDYRVTDL